MIEMVEERGREMSNLELRVMQALRLAVPACLDDKARRPFEKRESELLKSINDEV